MALSIIILVLLSAICTASANENQLNDDIRDELGRLKTEFRKLEKEVKYLRRQRISKVDALENEIKELKWLLKQQKMERSK